MSAAGRSHPTLAARVLVVPIEGYRRLISPFLGQRCRFHPSCSSYAVTAMQTHGAARGLWLAVRRIARCHPWNPGGVDHVPPKAHPLHDPLPSGTETVPVTAVTPSSSVITAGAIRCMS